jgi:hypothetical protein
MIKTVFHFSNNELIFNLKMDIEEVVEEIQKIVGTEKQNPIIGKEEKQNPIIIGTEIGYQNGSIDKTKFNCPKQSLFIGSSLLISDSNNNCLRLTDFKNTTSVMDMNCPRTFCSLKDKIITCCLDGVFLSSTEGDKGFDFKTATHKKLLPYYALDVVNYNEQIIFIITIDKLIGFNIQTNEIIYTLPLKRPKNIIIHKSKLFVTDMHHIKIFDILSETNIILTGIIGPKDNNKSGNKLGSFEECLFNSPSGMTIFYVEVGNQQMTVMLIADTGNNSVKFVNLSQPEVTICKSNITNPISVCVGFHLKQVTLAVTTFKQVIVFNNLFNTK